MAFSPPHGLCSCFEQVVFFCPFVGGIVLTGPFQAFSHTKSSVLDGGLPDWVNEGYEIETDPPNTPKVDETLYAVPTLNESVIRCGWASFFFQKTNLNSNSNCHSLCPDGQQLQQTTC